jgi:hypothetical protein
MTERSFHWWRWLAGFLLALGLASGLAWVIRSMTTPSPPAACLTGQVFAAQYGRPTHLCIAPNTWQRLPLKTLTVPQEALTPLPSSALPYCNDTGTPNQLRCQVTMSEESDPVTHHRVAIKVTHTTTGPATLSINDEAPRPLRLVYGDGSTSPIHLRDIHAGQLIEVVDRGEAYYLCPPILSRRFDGTNAGWGKPYCD